MEIQTEALKRCHLVTLSGQIDSARAPELEEALLDLIDSGARYLVINFRDVPFVSSAGLSALLRARIRLRNRVPAGDIAPAEVPPPLMDTFELVGLQYVFSFYDSNLDAVGSF